MRKLILTLVISFILLSCTLTSESNELRRLKMLGYIDSNNSTAVTLTAGAAFTGTATSILDFGTIFVGVYSDQASAIDGLQIQQSWDSTNWHWVDKYSTPAMPLGDDGKRFSIQPDAAYMRVVYTNGLVNQGEFQLFVKDAGNSLASSHRILDMISGEDDATLGKFVMSALFNGTGLYGNITATASGNLRVANAEDGLAIAMGDVIGRSPYHKFGKAPDFDPTDGFVTVWDGAEDGSAHEQMLYQYSTTADIDSVSSSDAGDAVSMTVEGLDANWEYVTQSVTLNGQTRVALSTDLVRSFRMENTGSTDLAGTAYCYVNSSITLGVPDDSTQIRAIIDNGNNKTLMSLYTVPDGSTGCMRSWFAGTAGAVKTSVHEIQIRARKFGSVFTVEHDTAIVANGTSHIHHPYVDCLLFEERTDIEIRMNTDTTASGVSAGFDFVLQEN